MNVSRGYTPRTEHRALRAETKVVVVDHLHEQVDDRCGYPQVSEGTVANEVRAQRWTLELSASAERPQWSGTIRSHCGITSEAVGKIAAAEKIPLDELHECVVSALM